MRTKSRCFTGSERGWWRRDTPPADPSLRAQLLEEPNVIELEPLGDVTNIIVQTGPKWLATGVAPETQRAVFARLAPYAKFYAAPGEAAAVRELTGVEPRTFPTTRAWVEALNRGGTVVTVDTGAAHVAGMLSGSVVDVFPDGDFEAQVRRWRPWASRYRAFRASEVDGGPNSRFIESILDGF